MPGRTLEVLRGTNVTVATDRGIDHIVLCVDRLDAAQRLYQSLGFTTTPAAHHPFGTANSLVQLQGSFVELVAVAEPQKIPPPTPGHFSFGQFIATYAAARQGMAMAVFRSDDARRDQAEFRAAGLTTYAPLDFSRQATLPDGSAATVSFSLAFVSDPRMPEAGFFVCQQHAPQHFWQPAYQRHGNGALDVAEIIMVAPDPPALADLFGKLHGRAGLETGPGRLAVATSRGLITVLDGAGFEARFPGMSAAARPETPHFAGYRLAVADLARTEAALRDRGTLFVAAADTIRIAPSDAAGVVIEFAAETT